MTVVDFKKAKNKIQHPPEDFASLLELLSNSYKIVNANLAFLWPYALFLYLITDGGVLPSSSMILNAGVNPVAFIHSIFGITFLQLIYTIFASFIVVGFRRPSFAGLKSYIYDQRKKLMTFAAVMCGYYFFFSIASIFIVPIVLLPLFFFLIAPICMFEARSYFSIFTRSAKLIKGAKVSLLLVNMTFIVGSAIVFFILVKVPTLILGATFGANGFISFLMHAFVGMAISYVVLIFMTYKILLYLKRVKKVA